MIKWSYIVIHYLTILLITLVIAAILVVSHPDTTRYFVQKYLNENMIGYSRVEGSLLNGITLYDIDYPPAIKVKRFTVKYGLLALLNPTPLIKRVELQGVTANLDNLPQDKESDSEFSMIPFAVTQLHLKDIHILFDGEELRFDLDASRIRYSDRLDVNALTLRANSSYGTAEIIGEIKSDHLHAKASLTPETSLVQKHLGSLTGLPQTLPLDLEATLQNVFIRTHFDRIDLADDSRISGSACAARLHHRVDRS